MAQNPTYNVTVNSIPADIASFEAMRDSIASTPEGGAVAFVIALKMYMTNPTEGIKAIIVAVDQGNLGKSNSSESYKGYGLDNSAKFLIGQLKGKPNTVNSYLPGSSRQNGYTPANPPYNFTLSSNRFSGSVESGEFKVFIPSSGADTPRPITMKRNTKGIWKASGFSSIVVGVAAPVVTDDGDDL